MASNYKTGHEAEKLAAEHLKDQGFKIRELNWKTRQCEVDIVAEKHTSSPRLQRKRKVIYFVEVKYRRTPNQGIGLDYITPTKLKRMQFAAEMWVAQNKWQGDYQLAAISIDGDEFTFVEDI